MTDRDMIESIARSLQGLEDDFPEKLEGRDPYRGYELLRGLVGNLRYNLDQYLGVRPQMKEKALRQRAKQADAENARLRGQVETLRDMVRRGREWTKKGSVDYWEMTAALAATEPAPCTEHEWKADASPDPNNPRWFFVDGGGMAKARNVECARCGIDGLDALAATEPKEG